MLLALAVAGCGSSSTSNQPKPTGLKKRVLLSNQASSTVNLLDAQKDTFTTKNLGASSPTKLVTAGGITAAMDSAGSVITIIDNTTEAVISSAPIGDQPFDIAIEPDGKKAWAAMRDFGFVQAVDTSSGVAFQVLRISNARRLVMSPKGTKMLVFPDPQSQVSPNTHTFFVVDTTTGSFQTITDAVHLDQPFTAVFGSSDTQAFVLNCGAECGGTAASVVSVDFTNATTPVFAPGPAPIPVAGATVGLMNGTNLYVAGTSPTLPVGLTCPISRCGELTVINTGALTAGNPVAITDGDHENMAFTNNRLYIGSRGCTVQPGTAANTVRGCLSIFNTGSSAVTFPAESSFRQNFDVTGLQPISNRSIIYVIQGGEIDFFDTTTDAIATGITPIDVVGKGFDVVQIDP
jgi:hypothetical protein